jgi:hypothetical protein
MNNRDPFVYKTTDYGKTWTAITNGIPHMETGERYDDPFRAALRGMWAAHGSGDGGALVRGPHFADTEVIAGTGLFEALVHKTHARRIVRPVEAVVGVENTRATSLSWPDDIRREFTEELRQHLRSQTEVQLTQETSLTMARVLPRPSPGQPEAQEVGR